MLDVILGARYEYIEADAGAFADPVTGEKDSFSDDWDALVGSARLLYRLLPEYGVNVYAGVSQGFRAPNFSDLTRLDTARTDEIETAAPGLDPEYFVSYEGGVRIVQQSFQADVAYYYTDISDLIVRTPTGRTIDGLTEVTKKNAGDGYVQGVELSGQVRMGDDFLLWGNLAWMDGEVDTFPTSSPEKAREPLDRLLPLTANVALRYEPSSRGWIEALVTAADRQDDLSTRDKADTQRIPPGGTPGYTVLTLRGGWSVTPDLTLSLALENVTDENYRIHGSGLNEPGRNFVCAVDYVF